MDDDGLFLFERKMFGMAHAGIIRVSEWETWTAVDRNMLCYMVRVLVVTALWSSGGVKPQCSTCTNIQKHF
jgi:hypothetical protein